MYFCGQSITNFINFQLSKKNYQVIHLFTKSDNLRKPLCKLFNISSNFNKKKNCSKLSFSLFKYPFQNIRFTHVFLYFIDIQFQTCSSFSPKRFEQIYTLPFVSAISDNQKRPYCRILILNKQTQRYIWLSRAMFNPVKV